MARVLPPPAGGGTPKPRTGDCSLLPEPQRPAPKEAKADEEVSEASDTENARIRQEPELPLHEDIAPVPPAPAGDFDFGAEDTQGDAARLRQAADRSLPRNVRTASPDPNAGIDLRPRRAYTILPAATRSLFDSCRRRPGSPWVNQPV